MTNRIARALAIVVCLLLAADSANADLIFGEAVFTDPDIFDDNPEVRSTITITDSGIIKNISVRIDDFQHTNAGDLIAELRYLGPGGPSGPGMMPAYLFFRPNVGDVGGPGSQGNLSGNYTFTDDPADADFWMESAIDDDQTVPSQDPYFASDVDGIYHDLGGPDFFEGFNAQGDWELIITDAATGPNENNDGSVEGWRIEFHVIPIPEPGTTGTIFAIFALAAAIRRRKS